LELKPEELRAVCPPESLGFATTAEVADVTRIVGQERAVAAIDFGLEMSTLGYNLYVAGPAGTGRTYAVLSRATEVAAKRPSPDDWCYIYNFDDPRQPLALSLPAGQAPQLARDVEEMVAACRQDIARAFESEAYEKQKEEAVGDVQAERNRLLRELDERARAEGLMIQPTPMGLVTVPLVEGQPMSREQFEKLPPDEKRSLEEKMERLRERIAETFGQARQLEKEARRRLEELDQQVAMFAIGARVQELKVKRQDQLSGAGASGPAARSAAEVEVVKYLNRMAEDIVAHRDEFRAGEAQEQGPPAEIAQTRYQINVLVTTQPGAGAPVIQEYSPTYYNLAGRLEYRPFQGGAVTDFTLIKPGSLHRANGGFLILRVLDVLLNPFAWEALKRALRSRELTIENIGEQWTPIPAATLRPQPIPLDVKVVLVGSPLLYFLLYHYDEEFGRLFKVRADFEVDMKASDDGCRDYATFIATHCRQKSLRHLTKEAVARVTEYGLRLAGDKEKLSTRFTAVTDLIEEANFWAGQEGAELIGPDHVERALERKEYRSRRLEDRLFEFIARGDILLEVTGSKVGQVNGLAVLDLGDYAFGRPNRITAQVTPGRAGVVNIEREARLSGEIYNKAVMILTGYLTGLYASEEPLSLAASVVFEQSYEMVEGDSASCAEVCAVLSALSGVPIRQGVAITGSVDQSGNVQPIGGVNQKIEGFFAACKIKGLTGDQGVIIPRQNVKNLTLKPEVMRVVAEGKFHVWAVSHVNEAVEILTGVRAGSPQQPETIHGRAAARLKQFSEALRGAKEERTTHIIEVPPGVGGPPPPHAAATAHTAQVKAVARPRASVALGADTLALQGWLVPLGP
jgi:lon-related putative ATP-dependent protease